MVTCVSKLYTEHTLHVTSIRSDFRTRRSILEVIMSNKVEYAFPAGDESDGSNDEWDIGFSKSIKVPLIESTDAGVPEAEDKVSTLKRAINTKDVQLVQQLLDNGLDVETRLGFEWTPLMCAVHMAHYDIAKLLLDRGASANFSRDQYTVLMAACTASASEDKIVQCVELLLSRNADPNTFTRSRMTSLMLASRDGYSQVINLLLSHGAEVNSQDENGYTALSVAVQYGREEAVLKLLQLGADKTLKTKAEKSAADLAKVFKRPQIARILASPGNALTNGQVTSSKEETLFKFFKRDPDLSADSKERLSKLCDIELLLHGLNLEYLSDIMLENDITWSYLVTMEKDDLEKIGISDPKDQQKVLSAVKEMHLDRVDLDTVDQLENIDTGSEELYNFLISLRQQCCYLTETVQDVISRFPRRASELVLSLDPKKEAQAICNELVAQTGDLQKEVACLKNLLHKMDPAGDFCPLPQPGSHGDWRRRVLKRLALSMLGAGLLFALSRAKSAKVYL
ncbi:ankyrin repeat, SAM and basic leucine zipper domain-containing protein 1 isoform X1 [Oncorhynchus tshawytscha]|uniref:Ankyrin repeat, SAM and basic leucine zipper domain-containing protein 1 n=1 Tax=Oncorhynchus tshawytscha TaxID=74940 RepID=A0A8C8FK83_ONCTS|nr:ankyrin repeat, SAM and basic leucine zipper domain-containing protein 1 isoform X1 [Oncorhynchus tshawytscha]